VVPGGIGRWEIAGVHARLTEGQTNPSAKWYLTCELRSVTMSAETGAVPLSISGIEGLCVSSKHVAAHTFPTLTGGTGLWLRSVGRGEIWHVRNVQSQPLSDGSSLWAAFFLGSEETRGHAEAGHHEN
jgi:hypothetical protein